MKNKIIDLLSRLWFPLLMLLCFIILTLKFASGQNVEIRDSKRLIEIDQTQKAIVLLNQAVQVYPSIAAVWYHLGYAQLKNGQRELAVKSFDKGIALDDKEPLNFVGRGYLSMLENNAQKAKLDFDKALSITKSKNTSVLKAIAEAYLVDIKFVNTALELLLKSKNLDDHDPETFILLGDAYLAQNNGGLAVTSYERSSSLDTKLATPYYKTGLVYLRSRNFPSAAEAFTKAIENDSNYTFAYKELGELYYQLKEGQKAVKAYEKYLSLTDKPESGKLRYAFFLFMAKYFSKANEIFQGVIEKESVSPTTLRFYAFSLYEAGDYQKSQHIFERYFSETSQAEIEAADYAYYGKLLLKENKDSLAIIQLQKSLALESNQTEILQLEAEALFKTKKYPDAIGAFERLVKLKPKFASQDFYTLGRAYYFNKQYEQADSAFQKLIELQPNMTVGYVWKARTKSNLDPESENGLAKPFYETVIEKASAAPEKSRNDLLEAYSYLGYYHFVKDDLFLSKSFWQKVLELNPKDIKAQEALKAIKIYWQKMLEANPNNVTAKEGLKTFNQ